MSRWIARLFVAVGLVFLLVVAIRLPQWMPSIDVHRRKECVSNLRLIEGAKKGWSAVSQAEWGTVVRMEDLTAGTNATLRPMPKCPSGGTYTVGAFGEFPTCSVEGHSWQ
jgi:hypothetical protein